MDLDVARSFLVALLIGALVGIDRERRKALRPGASFGGLRTHILVALLGAASARLALQWQLPWAFGITLAVVGAAVIASYVHQNRAHADEPEHDEAHGLTSEVAALVVFLLAALVVAGDAAPAVALGVLASAVLAWKQPLHGAVRRLDTADVLAGLKLLIASFIVLPLLPDAPVDPWQALNPYRLWLLVILISAMSLAGYVAMRWLGRAHGTAITGLAGGLVSSTAATVSLARRSQAAAAAPDDPAMARDDACGDAAALAAGILLAWLVMIVRVLLLVAMVNRPLLALLWPALAAMGGTTAVFAGWHYRASLAAARLPTAALLQVGNPFSLMAATRFGALFAAVLLMVELVERQGSAYGVHLVAALAGSVDVDAIALSLAQAQPGASGSADLRRAAVAITLAMLSNTLVKCAIVLASGAGPLRRRIARAAAAVIAAGAIVLGLG